MKNHSGKSGKRNKSLYIVIIVLVLLLVSELTFHLLEIGIGKLLILTNSQRSRTGRMWEEEEKDVFGNVAADSIARQIQTDSLSMHHFASFYDLHSELLLHNRLILGRQQFLNFYLSIPTRMAKTLYDPMKLLSLQHDPTWERVEIVLNGSQMSMFFKNGFNDTIQEAYLDVNSLTDDVKESHQTTLANIPQYRNRIVPASIFYQAYLQLPLLQRLQIMNDPYTLLYWGSDLQRIGISSEVNAGTVPIAFEVMTDYKLRIHMVNASEMAVEYLISAINNITGEPLIKTPR